MRLSKVQDVRRGDVVDVDGDRLKVEKVSDHGRTVALRSWGSSYEFRRDDLVEVTGNDQ